MQMGMVKQILAPGVKNSKEADLGAEMFRIGSNGLQRLGRGPEENAVDGPLVLQGDLGNLLRHRKDNVKILRFEQLGLPVFDPFGACQGLALVRIILSLGTVTI